MIYEIYNPDIGEYCTSIGMNDNKCYGITGRQPINEACGGCVGCQMAQAIHYGYIILNVEDGFAEEHY
jgi:hypothetical protein